MLLTPQPSFVPDGGSPAVSDTASATKAKCPAHWRRRLRNLLCLLAAVGCIWLFRAQLLRAASYVLVCDEGYPEGRFSLVLGGDRFHRNAARLYEERNVEGILLVERPPDRLERMAILPSTTAMVSEELARGGVPVEKIQVLTPASLDNISLSSVIALWVEQNPTTNLVVLCDEFSSRALRWSLDRRLSRADAGRVHLSPLKSRRYEERNWWHSKEGTTAFVGGWLSLLWPLVHGERESVVQECDPELFHPAIP